MKCPTSLSRLRDLIELYDEDGNSADQEIDTQAWLRYIFETLTARKIYHKKRQIVQQMSMKLLKEHLSEDEIQQVNEQARQEAGEASAVNSPEDKQMKVSTEEEDEEMNSRSVRKDDE